MKTRTTHKGLPKALSTSQKKVIGKGSKSKINLSDMPETVFSRKARRGLFLSTTQNVRYNPAR